jgi:hypothetical protein
MARRSTLEAVCSRCSMTGSASRPSRADTRRGASRVWVWRARARVDPADRRRRRASPAAVFAAAKDETDDREPPTGAPSCIASRSNPAEACCSISTPADP